MATDVLMPQMGESIAEGTIVKWLKKVGDAVQRDEPLFEISTDKVDAEVPSTVAGVLTEILAKEGETVAVNSVVARLGEAGAASAPAAQPAAPPAPAAAPPSPRSAAPPTAPPAIVIASPVTAEAEARRVRSSPLVRNMAREHEIDLDAMTGTGTGGRITKEDVLNFLEQRKSTPASKPATATAALPTAPRTTTFAPGERVHIEAMSVMRRKIAEHMVLSRRTSAHVTTFFEVDYTNIARLRERHKKTYEERNGVKLTYLPFIIRATIDALKAFPVVNASLDGERIVY